ncbi:glycosyltransferase [Novosphingobium sp. ZN18A2]|uniref:glycosyltransferase n=1 Tax=Novosphingobium sp. ZN18A2 TaxID=3079861 RepID=UPI0030D58128
MKRPLRIAIPIHSGEPGGVERVALGLAREWLANGDAPMIVLGRREGAMIDMVDGLPQVMRPNPIPTAQWETLWMIWSLWRYLKDNEADVIFCSGNTYAVVAVAMKLLRGKKCPPVVAKVSNDLARIDMPAFGRPFYRFWLHVQGRLFQRNVGMAEPMRAEIADAMGIEVREVAIIRDPSLAAGQYERLCAIDRKTPRSGPPVFVAVGRLASQKNFPLLLRAFATGAPADAQLAILGEGPVRGQLEKLAERLGISSRLTLAGHVTDITPWLEKATALVMSSDYEGVPAVVIEALAAGLPVAATDCSVSMQNLLGEGRFGILAPVGDEAAFADALGRIATFRLPVDEARATAASFTVAKAAPRYRALFAAAGFEATGFETAGTESTGFETAGDRSGTADMVGKMTGESLSQFEA